MSNTLPFIGREQDLASALARLDLAGRGTPSSLLVRGEAGIGKSRLAAELVGRAQAAGFTPLTGRADEFDRGIPYAVIRDMLARLPAPSGAGPLRTRLDALREGLDAGAGMLGAPDDAHLLLVFDRALEALRALTADAPVVLLVDDAQLADADSLS